MSEIITVRPSYGRDYKTAKEVKEAWEAGKDFTICSYGHMYDGSQINKQDVVTGMVINIRYAQDRRVCVININ